MSNDITTAIEDPYGHGFEGRVQVDRQSSERRKHIATVVRHFSMHSLLAPAAVQYEYLLCYGYYTAEEMKDHPGRRKQVLSKAELENMEIEQEIRDTKQQEFLVEQDGAQWERHERRVKRWGQKRLELEQRKGQNGQHEDDAGQHENSPPDQHYEVASQQDAADQHDDAASEQDEPMDDEDDDEDEDEQANFDLLSDRALPSGWSEIERAAGDNIQGAFGRRHASRQLNTGLGDGQGPPGVITPHEPFEPEGSSSTGNVYMSGALQGGYGRGRGGYGRGRYGRGRGRGGYGRGRGGAGGEDPGIFTLW